MGLIRLLAIILVSYLALRLISRYVLPFLARYFVNKATKNMKERMETKSDGEKVYQDDNITIRKGNKRRKDDDDDGEFVDYEEV